MSPTAQGQGVDLRKLWDEPEPEVGVDLEAIWNEPTAGEITKSALGSFAGGAVSALGTGLEGLGIVADKMEQGMPEFMRAPGSPFREAGKAMQDFGERQFAPERAKIKQAGGATAFLGEAVPGALGQSAGLGAAALATGGVGGAAVGTATIALTGAAAGMASGYNDAIQHGADEDTAWESGVWNALAGTSEAIPLAKAVSRVLGKVSRPALRVIRQALIEGGEEFGQEAGTTIAGNIIASENVLGYDDRAMFENAIQSGAAGGLAGFLLSALGGKMTIKGPPDAEAVHNPTDEPDAGLNVNPSSVSNQDAPAGPAEPVATEPVQSPEDRVIASLEANGAATTHQVPDNVPRGIIEPIAPVPPPDRNVTATDPPAPARESTTETAADARSAPAPEIETPTGGAPVTESASKRLEAVPEAEKRSAPPPPGTPTDAATDTADLSDLTGIKNAAIDAERALMGLEPATHGERRTAVEEAKKAKARLDADPTAGERLVAELTDSPRQVTVEDEFLLSMEAVRLKNERDAARAEFDAAVKAGEGVEAAQARVKKAADAYIKLGEVATLAGTDTAQALAFRAAMFKRDYSLAEMERAATESKGEPLTKEEAADVQALHDEIARLNKDLSAALAAKREAESRGEAADLLPAIKARARRNRASRPSGAIRERLARDAEASRAALKIIFARGNTFPLDAIPHAARIGADLIARGQAEFSVWSEAIIGELGERARPHLQAVFEASKKLLADLRVEYLSERVADRIASGKEIGPYAQKLAEHFVGEGITELDPLVDAVHAVLVKVDPEITKTKTRDAISGYGIYRQLTEDEVKRKLADLKGQAQKVAQIEALEKKIAPLKTGFERVEPSAKQRTLQKRVNELRKQAGIKTQDPAKALKTALQSKETSLKNRIEALRTEIDTGKLSTPIDRPVPRSDVTDALEAELAALRKEHEAVFGKKEATDEQRAQAAIKATERAIAEAERRVKERDIAPRGSQQGPGTEPVEALRRKREALHARLEALRDELALLRDSLDPERSARAALQAKKTRDANTTAELLERIERQDFGTKPPRPPIKMDPEAVAIEAEKKAVQVKFARLKRKYEYENRTKKQKVLDAVEEALNLPRAIWSSFDVSAVFRQGGMLTLGTNPVTTARQVKKMFRALSSEQEARRIDAEIRARPGYEFGRLSKLELTGLDSDIGPQEEAIRSRFSDRIPGVAASNRAYITFLNMQRAEAFDAMVRAMPTTPTLEDGKALAHFINAATGRGEIKKLAPLMRGASTILWSPRLLLSRFQLLAGEPALRATPKARNMIARQYAKSILGLGALYALALMAGADVGDDPRGADFGKIKVGNSTIDPLAGLSQVTVLLSRLATGETKTRAGKIKPIRGEDVEFKGDTAATVLGRFVRTKLTPILGAAVDVVSGEDVVGQPATLESELAQVAVPLSLADIYKAIRVEGVPEGLALGILGIFGMGIQTIEDRK